MLGIHDLGLSIAAGLLLNVTPGPDMLYVIGTSTARGTRAGVMAAVGIGAGCLVHVTLAAIGLSAVLAASSWAFSAVKYAGAAYLLYMGARMLQTSWSRSAPEPVADAAAPALAPEGPRRVFWQGFVTNVFNPKVALFFLAFLPQFIDAASPSKAWAFVLLGLVFTVNGTIVTAGVALLAGRLGRWLSQGSRSGRWIDRVVGCMFIGLGLRLALSRP